MMHYCYVMSAIASIGNAVKYDVAEDMLAHGASLASVYAFAAHVATVSEDHDHGPISTRATEYPATVRPGRKVA